MDVVREREQKYHDAGYSSGVLDERERCAKIAETTGLWSVGDHISLNDIHQIQRQIAAVIRDSGTR